MDVYLKQAEILKIIPFSRQHILRLEKENKFPKRVQLGIKRIAWRKSDIEKYMKEKEAS